MENYIEIYWNDLSEDKQLELTQNGFDNQNIIDGVFPLTTIYLNVVDEEEGE